LTGGTVPATMNRGKMRERSSARWGVRRGIGVIILAQALVLGAISSSRSEAAEDRPVRRAELLLFGPGSAGRISAGVYIELMPGWHTYWINPGDAGLAPELRWRLPAGFEPGALRFPTPEKLVEGDSVSYVYRGDVLLLCDIKTPRDLPAEAPLCLTAVLDWMACRESCLTGRDTLRVDPAGLTPAGLKRSREILARFAARFPKPAPDALLSSAEAGLVKSARVWAIDIVFAGRAGSRVRDFFPLSPEGFVIANSRVTCGNGRVTIPVTPSDDSGAIVRVSGLLIIEDAGYKITLPVKR
jgi:DsbC/DsbD-like thiol-disulfide interchange protein